MFSLMALAFFACFQTIAASATLTNCVALTESLWGSGPVDVNFDVTARVAIAPGALSMSFLVEDDSGGTTLWYEQAPHGDVLQTGDLVHLKGRILAYPNSSRFVKWESLGVLAHGEPPPPHTCTAKQLLAGEFRHTHIRLKAFVKDVFRDEIDPDFLFLTLICDGESLYAALFDKDRPLEDPSRLVGSTVSVCGHVNDHSERRRNGISRNLGVVIHIPSPDQISVLSAQDTHIGELPKADDLLAIRPADVPNRGKYQTHGRVLAVWHGDRILLRTNGGLVSRIDLAHTGLPKVGQVIDATGFPASDLFNINLIRATWSPAETTPAEESVPESVSAEVIALDDQRRTCFKPAFHGKLLRLEGTVRRASSALAQGGVLVAENDGVDFTIDASAIPESVRGITDNYRISIIGICVLDIEDWRPNETFPRIRGFSIVPRAPDDITVLSRPSWWTPVRLVWGLAVVCAILLVSAIANVILHEILTVREHELESQIVAKVESDLKTRERTRLAIELHDSISQNLTGVALELQTIARSKAPFSPDIGLHLNIAKRALGSCRDELRRCLWDLRHDMLEEQNVETAIRRTLEPHIGKANLFIRFPVDRERISDNTMHAILRALRELTTNAIRHGQATSVKVAGSIESGCLMFSVTDNGCGFDPHNCPGVADGHYGLLGIGERFSSLGGTFEITSKPGRTKAVCTIPLHGMAKA